MGKATRSTGKKAVDELTYEEAFRELESVLDALESDEHTLDETMLLYERGQELARHCGKLIERAELKVKKLAGDDLTDFLDEG